MKCVVGSAIRIAIILVIGAFAVTAGAGSAQARHVRHWHVHHSVTAKAAVPSQAAQLGPMRYFGGPKSPMWRSPVAVEARSTQVAHEATRLGPMRYYGGPKSPMWRGPVTD